MPKPAVFLKQLGLGILFWLLPAIALAQPTQLNQLNTDQFYTMQLGMQVLGSWALGNIMYSSFLLPKASRSRRYFYQLSLFWNLVNLLIAIAIFYLALTADPDISLAASIRLHYLIRNVLMLGLGLSVAFLFYGRLLQKNARMARKPERHWGFGRSVIVQALFLLFFCIGFYLAVLPYGRLFTNLIP